MPDTFALSLTEAKAMTMRPLESAVAVNFWTTALFFNGPPTG
jgi:hypothetical protein